MRSPRSQRAVVAAALLALSASVGAQPAQTGAAPPAVALPYASALAGYRPYADIELADWRAANERVREVGGHSGALKAERANAPTSSITTPGAGPVPAAIGSTSDSGRAAHDGHRRGGTAGSGR